MTLIKYYNLESRSWEEVSDLERNLKKHLLNERHVNNVLETDVEKLAEGYLSDGNEQTMAMVIYDSGEFDVIYKRSWEISKGQKGVKKGWFRKDLPEVKPRIGIELVVKTMPNEILELQDYLTKSGFEVVEARKINAANFGFSSSCCHVGAVKNYKTMVEAFIKNQYPKITAVLTTEEKVKWSDEIGSTCTGMIDENSTCTGMIDENSTCTGMIYGSVLDVLKIRQVLLKNGYGISIKTESVSFLN